ncbi:tRNA 2-selenouridine synthase [Bacillus mesophilus]|uniref:tRNA 2-selenouridine(34) synthase MnmH n=1 Tax=Bacillus mesophilus TaxID=1808955 RepID=A0A6M0Q205_9BACI|nr:tRNA 2-selenouridine(34) synthase MnmH [Bacillus mesophilus]MBM7659259.1 tRNA 2-selenouridine synthase [Bacillus mesophilus]NEY70133.1 tRNA 2-selenouridine(34) synthase MnmH [Bacillus mesophilus]
MEQKLIVPKISIDRVLEDSFQLIDVRSPSEYKEFHIPGAISLPIFTDEERAKVGTIYKQEGNEFAKDIGVELLSKKLPALFKQIKELSHNVESKPLVVYCWRGGMRSKSIVTMMSSLDISILQLEGGIRSYRKLIIEELAAHSSSKQYIVLEGLTGTKKTDILTELEKLDYPVINIEELASHRGSIFGQIGLKPRSQKEFESLLYHRLMELKNSPYYIIEAESKRLGSILLPDFLLQGKERGERIHINLDLQSRAKTICETYHYEQHKIEFEDAINRLERHFSSEVNQSLKDLLQQQDIESVVAILLKEYYDPKYEYTSQKYTTRVHTLEIHSLQDGVNKVSQKIDELVKSYSHV